MFTRCDTYQCNHSVQTGPSFLSTGLSLPGPIVASEVADLRTFLSALVECLRSKLREKVTFCVMWTCQMLPVLTLVTGSNHRYSRQLNDPDND